MPLPTGVKPSGKVVIPSKSKENSVTTFGSAGALLEDELEIELGALELDTATLELDTATLELETATLELETATLELETGASLDAGAELDIGVDDAGGTAEASFLSLPHAATITVNKPAAERRAAVNNACLFMKLPIVSVVKKFRG